MSFSLIKFPHLELSFVVPVLAKGPHDHLVGAGHCEDPGGGALGHHGEAHPGQNLDRVFGNTEVKEVLLHLTSYV